MHLFLLAPSHRPQAMTSGSAYAVGYKNCSYTTKQYHHDYHHQRPSTIGTQAVAQPRSRGCEVMPQVRLENAVAHKEQVPPLALPSMGAVYKPGAACKMASFPSRSGVSSSRCRPSPLPSPGNHKEHGAWNTCCTIMMNVETLSACPSR